MGMVYWCWIAILVKTPYVDCNPPPFRVPTGNMTVCSVCLDRNPDIDNSGIKPNRAHHCRRCKRCVLKMDHHCAYLGTCIGLMNYKPFLLFVMYAMLLSFIYSCCMFPTCAFLGNHSIWEESERISHKSLLTTVMVVVTFLVSLVLMWFLQVHIRYVLKGCTTLENLKKHYPEHRPVMERLREVYGPNMCLWFLPIGRPIENGYEFENLDEKYKNPKMVYV